jgi:hypothetical protein
MAMAASEASEQHALRHVNAQLDLSLHSSGASTAVSSITGIGGGHSFFGRGASVYTDQYEDEDEEDEEYIPSISHHLQSQSNGDHQSQSHRSQSQSSYSKLLASIDCLSVSAAPNSRDSEYINNCDESSAFSSCLTPFTTGSTYVNDNDNDAPSLFSATTACTSGDGSASSSLLESHGSIVDRSHRHHHHRAPALTTQTISGISTTQNPRGHPRGLRGGNTNNTSSTTHSSSRQTEVNDNDWQKIELEQENCRLVLELHRSMQKERQLSEMADILTKQMRKTLQENEDLTKGVQDLIQTCETLEKKKRHLDKENSQLYENNSMLEDTLREVYASAEELNKDKGKINKRTKENKETSGTEEEIDEEKDEEAKGEKNKDQDNKKELQQQLAALAKDNNALLKERTKMLQMVRFGEMQLGVYAHQLQALKLKQQKDQEHHEQHDYHDVTFIAYPDENNNHGPPLLSQQGNDEVSQSQRDSDSDHEDGDSVSVLLSFDVTAASEEEEEEEEKERTRGRGRSRKAKGKGKTLEKYEDEIVNRSAVSTSTTPGQTTDEHNSDESVFQKAESCLLKEELSQCQIEIRCLTQLLKQERKIQYEQKHTHPVSSGGTIKTDCPKQRRGRSRSRSEARSARKSNTNGYRSRSTDRLRFKYKNNSKNPSAVGPEQARRRATDAGGDRSIRTRPRRRSSSHPSNHHADRLPVPPSSSTSNVRRAGFFLLKPAQTSESAKTVRFSSSSLTSCSLAVKDDLACTLRGGLMASAKAKAKAKAKLNSISIAARNHPVSLRLE